MKRIKLFEDFIKESTNNVIGTSIKIANMEVAQHDFPVSMDFYDAVKAVQSLGKDWRLPTIKELDILRKNKRVLKFSKLDYWTNEYSNNRSDFGLRKRTDDTTWLYDMKAGSATLMTTRAFLAGVRAVKGKIDTYDRKNYPNSNRDYNIYEF